MAAAFELSKPGLRERFDVTVFQQGWRLGGKGASGRGPHGRIEEHGLHIWMGFYENAFRMLRDTYRELGRDSARCPIATWRDAFEPSDPVGLAHTDGNDWHVWSTVFPPLPGEPGTPLDRPADGDPRHPFSALGYLARAAEVMTELFRLAWGDRTEWPGIARQLGVAEAALGMAQQQLASLAALVARLGTVTGSSVVVAAEAAVRAIDALRARPPSDANRQRASEVLEVLLVCVAGSIRCGVVTDPEGFDKLDHWDFADFLRAHGATEAAADSPFVRGLYSLMFAFEDGDPRRPRVAAGQMMRGCLRMFFTYRGAFFWRMAAGMGDVVFAPLYEVLLARGVHFEFFHRLRNVGLARAVDGSQHIDRLVFDVQATTRGPYRPLVDVGGLPCWPSNPDFDQLVDGERLRAGGWDFECASNNTRASIRTLSVARDFDMVVLAIGLGEVPRVCDEILQIDARWRRMVDRVKTVATQALQLWLVRPMSELGWSAGPIVMTAFEPPLDTWADMTHLVPREAWPSATAPRAIAYFCNVIDERQLAACAGVDPLREARKVVADNARRFVERQLPQLWPGLLDDDARLRTDVFCRERDGGDWLASQYLSANVSPSDRYTLSLPGTPQYRISPLDRSYDNLTIAGDWTSCGLNLGCVEAAVISGMLAAHAISGSPALHEIVGFDHV
jgi:uncharacterized protein with NAD-binding domain and iron-sulfur cluster